MKNPGNGWTDSLATESRSWMRRLGRVHRNTRGGALVEFALTLPIMLLTITGIFSFSIAIYQKLELAEAVASAGREIALDRQGTDPCADTANALTEAAPTLTANKISISISLNGGKAITSNTCAGTNGGTNPNMTKGGTASVQASYPCSINAFRYTFPNCSVSASIEEQVQ